MDRPDLKIADRGDASRFEAHVAGELAGFVEYRWIGDRRVLLHTEVLPAFEGRGVGSSMARHILDAAAASGTRVTVKCPFIRTYVERHPEYARVTTPRRAADGSG